MTITKAQREQKPVRVLFAGYGGGGKSYTALAVATALAEKRGTRVLVLDAEARASTLYADRFDFDICDDWDHRSVEGYIDALQQVPASHRVVVVDGLTPAWKAILEESDRAKGTREGVSVWTRLTPLWDRLMGTIVTFDGDIICTAVAKHETVVEANDRGKMAPRRVGTTVDLRQGVEQHFDLAVMVSDGGLAQVIKSRYPAHLPVNAEIDRPGADFAAALLAESETGERATPRMTEDEREKLAWVKRRIDAGDWGKLRQALSAAEKAGHHEAVSRIRAALAEHDGVKPEIQEHTIVEEPIHVPINRQSSSRHDMDVALEKKDAPDIVPDEDAHAMIQSWWSGLKADQLVLIRGGSSKVGDWFRKCGPDVADAPEHWSEVPPPIQIQIVQIATDGGFGPGQEVE